MAKLISFVNFTIESFRRDTLTAYDALESNLLILKNMIDNKEYETNYSEAIKVITNIYDNVLKGDENLNSVIKKHFVGNYTRGIYALIIQDALNILSSNGNNYRNIEFSKYLNLVEDKEDIKLTSTESGIKLEAFNTKIEYKLNRDEYWPLSKLDELSDIIRSLGVVGCYFFFKVLLKVVVIKR